MLGGKKNAADLEALDSLLTRLEEATEKLNEAAIKAFDAGIAAEKTITQLNKAVEAARVERTRGLGRRI